MSSFCESLIQKKKLWIQVWEKLTMVLCNTWISYTQLSVHQVFFHLFQRILEFLTASSLLSVAWDWQSLSMYIDSLTLSTVCIFLSWSPYSIWMWFCKTIWNSYHFPCEDYLCHDYQCDAPLLSFFLFREHNKFLFQWWNIL